MSGTTKTTTTEEATVEIIATVDQKQPGSEEEEKKDGLPGLGLFERPKVVGKYAFGANKTSYLLEFEGVEACNGSTFIEGLSGVGTTATVVAAYLIGQLELPLVAVYYNPSLPPMTSIHKSVPSSPVRIYGNAHVCVAVGDYPLASDKFGRTIWVIARCLLQFANRHRCRHIICIDGFPIESAIEKKIQSIAREAEKSGHSRRDSIEKEVPNDVFSTLGYLTTEKDIALELQKGGHNGIKSGQILGVIGAVMQLAYAANDMQFFSTEENTNIAVQSTDDYKNENVDESVESCGPIPFSALLAPDSVSVPDRRGASLVVKLLQEIFGINIDSQKLAEQAERLAAKVMQTINEIQKQITKEKRYKSQPPPGMYN